MLARRKEQPRNNTCLHEACSESNGTTCLEVCFGIEKHTKANEERLHWHVCFLQECATVPTRGSHACVCVYSAGVSAHACVW